MTKIYMKPGKDIKDICNQDTIFPIATRAFARIQITRTAVSNKASAAMVQPSLFWNVPVSAQDRLGHPTPN